MDTEPNPPRPRRSRSVQLTALVLLLGGLALVIVVAATDNSVEAEREQTTAIAQELDSLTAALADCQQFVLVARQVNEIAGDGFTALGVFLAEDDDNVRMATQARRDLNRAVEELIDVSPRFRQLAAACERR